MKGPTTAAHASRQDFAAPFVSRLADRRFVEERSAASGRDMNSPRDLVGRDFLPGANHGIVRDAGQLIRWRNVRFFRRYREPGCVAGRAFIHTGSRT